MDVTFRSKVLRDQNLPPLVEAMRKSSLSHPATKIDCILLFKDDLSKQNQTSGQPIKPNANGGKEDQDQMNLTGNPLQCSFSLDAEDDENEDPSCFSPRKRFPPQHIPLAVDDARALINIRPWQNNCDNGIRNCWAVCDGKDHRKTLYLGSERDEGSGTVTLHQIDYVGPVDSSRQNGEALRDVELRHFKASAGGFDMSHRRTACSLYNLMGSFPHDSEADVASSLVATLDWTNPKRMLERPSSLLFDNKVKLVLNVVPGDLKMNCYGMYVELQVLKGLAEGLNGGDVVWHLPRDGEPSMEEDLTKILHFCKEQGPKPGCSNPLFAAGNRADVDFTDMLWKALSKSRSYAELCLALKQILDTLDREEIRPFVFAKNRTKVAEITRTIMRHGIGAANLGNLSVDDTLPLEMLVEIGAEKLRRDHVHSIGPIMTNSDAIAPFIFPSTTAFDCQRSIANLDKLHYVQETVALCRTVLSPSNDCLRAIIEKTLEELCAADKTSSSSSSLKLELLVCDDDGVKERLSQMMPCVWQCRFISTSPAWSIKTTVQLSAECPFEVETEPPPTEATIRCDGDDGEESDRVGDDNQAAMYHMTSTTSVTRKL